MYYLQTFIIFTIILFLYLHIFYHYKCSNDLEIYTIENPSKEKLEEICNIRQPVTFKFKNPELLNNCTLANIEDLYGVFDIKLRNIHALKEEESPTYLPLLLKESVQIFQNDKNQKYITENNSDFLQETGLLKVFRHNDSFLKPPLLSKCKYDFWSGSLKSITPLRYNLNFRNYFYLTNGKANIKLIPPKNTKYLYAYHDYENFEFISPINPWDIEPKYKSNFSKVKSLDVTLTPGDILQIPAYWWYSIQYESISSICVFQYQTFMNSIAILPETLMSLLQNQNIKHYTNHIFKSNENTNENADENAHENINKKTI